MRSHAHSYLITLGHLTTDITQGGIPALLPFLVAAYDLSYLMAAVLVFACSIVSAIVQPLFGYLGDRIDRPWFMSLGVLLAGAGISVFGIANQYWMLLVGAVICGIGVALFHPEGGKLANIVAGSSKGAGISNFSIGGNIGFAVGPIIVVSAIGLFGLRGITVFIVPAVVVAAILLTQTHRYREFTAEANREQAAHPELVGQEDWPGFLKVTLVNFLRSIVGNGITTFLALYVIFRFGINEHASVLMLTAYSAAGAVATFFGGRIADRVGAKKMILISFSVAAPMLLFFVLSNSFWLSIPFLIVFSLCCSTAYSPVIVTGQSYLPGRLGLASGISLGVVVSVGGLTSPVIGLVGDHWGLIVSMSIICAVSFLTAAAGVLVYRHRDKIAAPKPGVAQTESSGSS
ncbi:MAG: MFS transporter [Actinomycetia bacterium]|nr:MFS transporter [Actinomycetes bacterium]